jgi:hypothetical protein
MDIFRAALPILRSACTIFPPSSGCAVKVWKVLILLGNVGEDREEPYSTPILGALSARSERPEVKSGRGLAQ